MAVYVKAFYDWVEQTEALSDAERGRLFVAMLEYARSGEVPVLEGNERILFPVFKAQIDREEGISSAKAQSGAKGGRGKQNEAKASKREQTEAKASKREQTENLQANLPNKEEEYEKEKEEENEKEYKKESVKEKGADALTTLSSLFSQYSFSSSLQQHLEDWVQYKLERGEGYTERGVKALLRQIDSNVSRYGEEAVCDLMELSMASGWKGIIFDRLKDSPHEPPQKEVYTDDYYKGPKFGWGFEGEEEWNLCGN